MADNISDINIEVTDEGKSLSWVDSWDNSESVPRGMKVEVTYLNGDVYRRVFELAGK